MRVARFFTCCSALAVLALIVSPRQASGDEKPVLGESRGFAVQGHQFRLYQKHDLSGALTEQMLFAKDRVVISSDPHGTGALQSWQLIEPHRSVLLHDPVKGRFRFMDIVEDTPKGRLEMKFILADKNSYRLLTVARRKSHKLLDNTTQDFEVGCRSMEKGLQEQAADFDQLVQSESSAKAYRSVVQKNIMDTSCSDPKSDFATSMPSMLDGIMEVVNSDPQWNRKLADGDTSIKMANGKAQPTIAAAGSFLQCLRNHDLDAHASRIEAGFANYMKMISPAGKSGGFDWRITCHKLDAGGDSADPVDALGAFEPSDSHPPQIDFYKLATQMPKVAGQSTADSYAEVFFHEMIHYSLIADETYTKQMELCCSKPANRPMPSGQYQGTPACDALDATVRAKLYSQQFENATADQTGNIPLAKIRESLRDRLGTGADIMIDQFQTSIGTDYAKYKDDPRCANTQKGLTAECDASFKADLGSDYATLMTNCNSFGRSAGMSSTELFSYCGSFGAYEQKLLGLDTGKVDLASICRKKKTAANHAPRLEWFADGVVTLAHWLSWTHLSVDAFADDSSTDISVSADSIDDSTVQLFCSQVPQVHSVWGQVAAYDPYGTTAKSLAVTTEKQDSATAVGNDTTSSPIKASGDALSYDSHGPPATEYSHEPSTREHQILSDLNRQDSMFGTAASALSDRLAQSQFMPTANAQPASENVSRTNYAAQPAANSASSSAANNGPAAQSLPSAPSSAFACERYQSAKSDAVECDDPQPHRLFKRSGFAEHHTRHALGQCRQLFPESCERQ